MKLKYNLFARQLPFIALIAFILISYMYNHYHIAWILFLSVPGFYSILTYSNNQKLRTYNVLMGLIILITIPLYYYNALNPMIDRLWVWLLILSGLYVHLNLQYITNMNAKKLASTYVFVTILYLLIGFITGIWHPTWLIFLVAGALAFEFITHKSAKMLSIVSLTVVISFYIIGFVGGIWHPTWLIFIIIPMTAIILNWD